MSKLFPAAAVAAACCLLLANPALRADHGCAPCAAGCKMRCPPPHCHYSEGPPNLKFKKACPRPVCDPCNLEHYGYYATCWQPWAFDANYSHCVAPHTGTMLPPPASPPYAPRMIPPPPTVIPDRGRDEAETPRRPAESLPPPRKFDDKPAVRLLPRR